MVMRRDAKVENGNRVPPSPRKRYKNGGKGEKKRCEGGRRGKGEEKRWDPDGWISRAQIDFNFEEENYDRAVHGDGAQVIMVETWRSETMIPLRVDSVDGASGDGWYPGPEIPLGIHTANQAVTPV
jgi:hypothetical protein